MLPSPEQAKLDPMFLLLASLASAQDAQIQVKVPPTGSGMIVVDGADTGIRAPGIITLPPGEHTIQVNGDCVTASQTVTIMAGAKTIVKLEPQPVGGFAEIRVSDPAAVLKVDGDIVSAPAMLPLACGVHSLEASTEDMAANQELKRKHVDAHTRGRRVESRLVSLFIAGCMLASTHRQVGHLAYGGPPHDP